MAAICRKCNFRYQPKVATRLPTVCPYCSERGQMVWEHELLTEYTR